MASILYAWRTPAYWSSSPVDHTWVTTYDNQTDAYPNIGAVTGAGEDYFYCWGSFHVTGNPRKVVRSAEGDRAMAECLVKPNVPSDDDRSARGTIYTYGVDGVCHQLANQVLFATGATGNRPITVRGVRGYRISTFLYGTYGTEGSDWRAKKEACGAGAGIEKQGIPLVDEFEEGAAEVLADEPEKLAQLMALREGAQQELAVMKAAPGALDAQAINRRNQQMLDAAAELLGPEKYRELFDVEPGERVDLVDPAMIEAQRNAPSDDA